MCLAIQFDHGNTKERKIPFVPWVPWLERIWEEEFNDNTIINNILANNNVTYAKTIEYAVAEYFSELISTRDDRYDMLFELNDIISKTNVDFYDVSHNYLVKKLLKWG